MVRIHQGALTVIPTVFSDLLEAVFSLKTDVCAQNCAQIGPKLNCTGGGSETWNLLPGGGENTDTEPSKPG